MFTEFLHTIQALQVELADVRERNATSTDESRAPKSNIKDASQSGKNVGSQLNVSGDSQTHDSELFLMGIRRMIYLLCPKGMVQDRLLRQILLLLSLLSPSR